MTSTRQSREKAFFDQKARDKGCLWWGSKTRSGRFRMERRAEMLASRLFGLPPGLVLELGCGVGAFTRPLLKTAPGWRLFACDLSEQAVRQSASHAPDARHLVADVTKLPLLDNSLDAVVGVSVLHHVPLEPALSCAFRALKPGGLFWFSEPNMLNPQVALEKNVKLVARMLNESPDETAFVRWRMARSLKHAGFSEVSVIPFDFLHPWIPSSLIPTASSLSRVLEKIPLLCDIAGSLLIQAKKPPVG